MGKEPRFFDERLRCFRQVPKMDLHRHLEGSLRLETLLEIAAQHSLDLPEADLPGLVQMQPGDRSDFTAFLAKFQVLRQFYRSPEIIERITREAVCDAALDGVIDLELRFTPVALGKQRGFLPAHVMDWVVSSANRAAAECGIVVRLIASVNRHEPVEQAELIAQLAVERIDRGIVGLDLAGNEAQFSALPFASIFREARASGLNITVHAGEWGGAANVREAIEVFGAERIGHGVRVLEDPRVVDLVRERGTTLEVCLTSNVQSGVTLATADHPLPRLLDAGLNVTLNTDDPSVLGITLSGEYKLAVEVMGLKLDCLEEMILTSARAAFLPDEEREALARQIQGKMG